MDVNDVNDGVFGSHFVFTIWNLEFLVAFLFCLDLNGEYKMAAKNTVIDIYGKSF